MRGPCTPARKWLLVIQLEQANTQQWRPSAAQKSINNHLNFLKNMCSKTLKMPDCLSIRDCSAEKGNDTCYIKGRRSLCTDLESAPRYTVIWQKQGSKLCALKKKHLGTSSGGSVIKTQCFDCSGCGFDHWLGTEDPMLQGMAKKEKSSKKDIYRQKYTHVPGSF